MTEALQTEALEQEIRTLRALLGSERDPGGRVFAPLADAYRRAGRIPEALRLLNEGLAKHPDFATGHVVAAQLYVEQGLTAEGAIAARRALTLDGENVNALKALLLALSDGGDVSEAAEIRELLTVLEPDFEKDLAKAADAPPPRVRRIREPPPLPAEAATVPLRTPEAPVTAAGALPEAVEIDAKPLESPAGDAPFTPPPEEIVSLEALAAVEEPVVDLTALAPAPTLRVGTRAAEEAVVELAELAPDEEVVDLDALAPDEGVVDLDELAPDEEPIVDLPLLAPEPTASSEEPVVDLAALAPEPAIDEPVVDLSALAPDEDVVSLDALAPDDEPVVDLSALAPDSGLDVEEPILDVDTLAPDEDVLSLDALAPDQDVVSLDALAPAPTLLMGTRAPDDEEPIVDLPLLAPEPEPEGIAPAAASATARPPAAPMRDVTGFDEPVFDLDALTPPKGGSGDATDVAAPAPEPAAGEPVESPFLSPSKPDDIVIDLDALRPDSAWSTPSDPDATEKPPKAEAPDPPPTVVGAPAARPAEAPAQVRMVDAPLHDDHGEPVYTRTLAELYAAQGAVREALAVLARLRAEDPTDADTVRRISEIEAGVGVGPASGEDEVETLARDLAESGAKGPEVDSPFSWAEPEVDAPAQTTGPTIREYFDGLLSWEPREEP